MTQTFTPLPAWFRFWVSTCTSGEFACIWNAFRNILMEISIRKHPNIAEIKRMRRNDNRRSFGILCIESATSQKASWLMSVKSVQVSMIATKTSSQRFKLHSTIKTMRYRITLRLVTQSSYAASVLAKKSMFVHFSRPPGSRASLPPGSAPQYRSIFKVLANSSL